MIVESEHKASTIQSYLGNGWLVMPSYGHICDLPESGECGIEPPTFRPQYVITDKGQSFLRRLQKRTQDLAPEVIYLATDPDREGEAIAWHIQQAISKFASGVPTPRITFNEITRSAIFQALENPRTIDIAMVASQEARRSLDRWIGWHGSDALRKTIGVAGVSVGRVIIPATRMLVERNTEINNHVQETFYNARIDFATKDTDGRPATWFAIWDFKRHQNSQTEHFKNKTTTQVAASCRQFTVLDVKIQRQRKAPPPPFTTSDLQAAASVTLKIEPEHAMQLAQTLYDSGCITYHRTDNPNISLEAYNAIAQIVAEAGKDNGGLTIHSEHRTFKTKDDTQAAHEAIRPCHFNIYDLTSPEAANLIQLAPDSITEELNNLYKLIWRRAVASQLSDATYLFHHVELQAIDFTIEGRAGIFNASGSTLINKGWMTVSKGDYTEEPDSDANRCQASNPIPQLVIGEQLNAINGFVLEGKTRPPSWYTKASLIKQLEREGIGRPSTYAPVISKLFERKYATHIKGNSNERRIDATKLAINVVDLLAGRISFADIPYTREMEGQLDQIAKGELKFLAVMNDFHETLSCELENLIEKTPKRTCPECEKIGEQSQLILYTKAKRKYFACSRDSSKGDRHFYNCDDQGEPIVQTPSDRYACPNCNQKQLVRGQQRQSRGGQYYWYCLSCKSYHNDSTENDPSGAPVIRQPAEAQTASEHPCPHCAEHRLTFHAEGKFGPYFRCLGCNKTSPAVDGKPAIRRTQPASSTQQKLVSAKPCPACKIGGLVERKGKYGKFLGCNRYPECNYIKK